jgi:hypothetical protein
MNPPPTPNSFQWCLQNRGRFPSTSENLKESPRERKCICIWVALLKGDAHRRRKAHNTGKLSLRKIFLVVLIFFNLNFPWDDHHLSLFYRKILLKQKTPSQALVTHHCHPSYLGGWDWEANISKPVRTAGVAQGGEHILCKCKALSSK